MNILKIDECYREPLDIRQKEIVSKYSYISADEQLLMLQMMKEYRPRKIVEIGVLNGANSAIILNCMDKLNLDAHLYSVDINEYSYFDKRKKIGFVVDEVVPEFKDRWTLLTKHTIAGQLDKIGKDIDLCIIDTAHLLPGELLDFLAVFPYMSKNGILIFHDINTAMNQVSKNCIAPAVLFSAVVAEKYVLESKAGSFLNIAAFQITEDTNKYIENVINLLSLPWNYLPEQIYMEEYNKVVSENYSPLLLHSYYQNISMGMHIQYDNYRFRVDKLLNLQKDICEKVVVWGCGLWGFQLYNYILTSKWISTFQPREEEKQAWEALYNNIYYVDRIERDTLCHSIEIFCPIYPVDHLKKEQNLAAVIIATTYDVYKEQILQELLAMNIPRGKIHFIEELIYDNE